MAKQKVALECLSYHATASQDQTVKLANEPIKSAEIYKLYSFKFIGNDSFAAFPNAFSLLHASIFPWQISSWRKRKRVGRR